jgi:predicted phage gp36 major capsid-like protein
VSPLRQIARTVTLAGSNEWRGVSSVGSNTMRNNVRRLVGSADPNEPQLFDPTGQNLLGKRFYETSGLPNTVASGDNVLVYGDMSSLLIVDCLGLQVEVVSHLLGESRRPVGFRGLYAWWRVGSGLLTPKGVKILQIKSWRRGCRPRV